jgi:hypothetical protein
VTTPGVVISTSWIVTATAPPGSAPATVIGPTTAHFCASAAAYDSSLKSDGERK